MSERQVTALAMLYIGRLVTCGIGYLFTPQTNFYFLHKKSSMSVFLVKKVSYMYVLLSEWIEMLFHGQCTVNLSTDHLFINLG